MKHPNEEQLVHYHYGEGDDAARRVVEEHLSSCASCRDEYHALEQVLVLVDAAPVPERGENYGEEVWRRLVPRLKATTEERAGSRPLLASRLRKWWSERPWAPAAAVAVLVLAAFLVGRFSPRPGPRSPGPPVSAEVRDRILLVAVGDHLERSQMVLIELVNAKSSGTIDISAERQRAEDLVAANRLYRQTAARAGETGVASVLDELERVLVEIAHSPSRISQSQLDEIRRRIEGQGILFKVRVIDSEVQQREKTAPRDALRGSL
jgi:anti-sigma factor RsiW